MGKKQKVGVTDGTVVIKHQAGGPVTLQLREASGQMATVTLTSDQVDILFAALVLAKRESYLPY